jgi:hypothetical protein
MNAIEAPDKHHLLAAEGWLELGNELEAFKELDRIAPAFTAHPDVLRLRCRLYGKTRNWIAAVNVAKALCEMGPVGSLLEEEQVPRAEVPVKTTVSSRSNCLFTPFHTIWRVTPASWDICRRPGIG